MSTCPRPEPDPMESRRLRLHARADELRMIHELGGIDLRKHIIMRDSDGEPCETERLELAWLDHQRRGILAGFDKSQRRTKRRSRPRAKAAPKENGKVRDHLAVDFSEPTRLSCAVAESPGRDPASRTD